MVALAAAAHEEPPKKKGVAREGEHTAQEGEAEVVPRAGTVLYKEAEDDAAREALDPPEIGALPSAAAVLGEGAPHGKCPSTDVPKAVSDDVMRSAPMRAQFFNTRGGSSTTGA